MFLCVVVVLGFLNPEGDRQAEYDRKDRRNSESSAVKKKKPTNKQKRKTKTEEDSRLD